MNLLIDTILPQLKKFPYNIMLVALFPRSFFMKMDKNDLTIESATIFLLIAVALSSMVCNILFFNNIVYCVELIVANSIILLGTTMLCGLLLTLSWSIVGAKIRERQTLILYFYHSGFFNVLSALVLLLIICLFEEKGDITSKAAILALLGSKLVNMPTDAIINFLLILIVYLLIILVWGIAAWMAYNRIYKLHYVKTVISFLIYCFTCTVLSLPFTYIYRALYHAVQITAIPG